MVIAASPHLLSLLTNWTADWETYKPGRQFSDFQGRQGKERKVNSFSTTAKNSDRRATRSDQGSLQNIPVNRDLCPSCNERHHIDQCKEFMKKERKSLFFQKRLCMAWGLSDDHIARNCQTKTTCTMCNGTHVFTERRMRPVRRSWRTAQMYVLSKVKMGGKTTQWLCLFG